MLDVEAWIKTKLEAGTALVALLGSTDRIVHGYPNSFSHLPLVTFEEISQNGLPLGYADDKAFADESAIEINVWNFNDTITIAIEIDKIMRDDLWFFRFYSADVTDPDVKIRHRVMRYRRPLAASDLT